MKLGKVGSFKTRQMDALRQYDLRTYPGWLRLNRSLVHGNTYHSCLYLVYGISFRFPRELHQSAPAPFE